MRLMLPWISFAEKINVKFEISPPNYPHMHCLVDIAQILKTAPDGHIFALMLPLRRFTNK